MNLNSVQIFFQNLFIKAQSWDCKTLHVMLGICSLLLVHRNCNIEKISTYESQVVSVPKHCDIEAYGGHGDNSKYGYHHLLSQLNVSEYVHIRLILYKPVPYTS
jgi:hypothetical protein